MSTSTPNPTRITFYDIAMRPPKEKSACSPNPWKTRLALNFKALPYTTKWVPLPDIPKVRQSLNVPPCRKFADGSDFYTLPIIQDHSTGSLVGDSFDIAIYLQKTYPDSDLFPAQTIDYVFKPGLASPVPLSECNESAYPEYAKFNINVDAAFSAHAQLAVQCFPFDPATAELSKAEFVRRAGVSSWEDFGMTGDAREKVKGSFRDTLGDLAKLFLRDDAGPFMLGKRACYADFIVGAWLRMMRVTLPDSEWMEVREWHGGVFGRLFDALEVYSEVK